MNVKLVAYTKPVDELAEQGIETIKDFVAYVARVSNPNNQHNTETADKLINYLARNKHWSPFEMAHVVMEIETTRDIARQILRHRSFTFQEFSQRYANAGELGYTPKECRLQDNKNRQNSLEVDDEQLAKDWKDIQDLVAKDARIAYDWAIQKGIAKEQARAVLPEGMTNSRMYMTGSIRSWLHYIELRRANGTQKEHQEVALACARELLKVFDLEV